jgi:hypothetical protein
MFSKQYKHNKWIILASFLCVIFVYFMYWHAATVGDDDNLADSPTKTVADNAEIECTSTPCFVCSNISIVLDIAATKEPLGAGFYKQATAVDFQSTPLVVKIPHSTAGKQNFINNNNMNI